MVAGRHQVDETDGIRVFDEWTDEVDLSLDPETGRFQKRTRKPSAPPAAASKSRWPVWAGLGLAVSALFGSLGAGFAALALLVGAGGMALAILLFAPTVDVVLPEPVAPATIATSAEPPPIEVAPAEPAATREAKKAPKKAAPAEPTPSGIEAPQPPEVDAQLVVMPDPGFRGKPLDSSIKELDKKANSGKIGVVAGH